MSPGPRQAGENAIVAEIGEYRLLTKIATGGMAEIFLARREGPAGFAKIVALKRILPHLASVSDIVDMFLDEARLGARLNHPHIVQIHDFGRLPDANSYFIVMEYVPGENLLSVLRRARDLGCPVSSTHTALILRDACEALHYAHTLRDEHGSSLGIVHRDVTPSNLLLSYEGLVKLVDFGIAKAERRSSETATGALKGKYAYMSPEQALRATLDHRSDLFSLGIVGHELVTGRRLFHRDSELDVLKAITEEEIPKPRAISPDVPLELEIILMRALAREPDRRFATAQEMQLALEEFILPRVRAGAGIGLARYLTGLFGEVLAATKMRWATGEVQVGDPTVPLIVSKAPNEPRKPAPAPSLALDPTAIPTPIPSLRPRAHYWLAIGLLGLVAMLAGSVIARFGGTSAKNQDRVEESALARSFLTIDVTPASDVFIDGEPLGSTPIDHYGVVAGNHRMTLIGRNEGYRIDEWIETSPGQLHTLKRTLGKGKLVCDAEPSVEVFAGDRRLGMTPLGPVSLTEGNYTLRLVGKNGERSIQALVKPGKVTYVREKL